MKERFAGDSESDHIALLRAFRGWEEAKRYGRFKQYCWDHFLSHNTLEVIVWEFYHGLIHCVFVFVRCLII